MEKICKQCNTNFELLQEDLDFYEKMKSPAPNYCWECRVQRRLAHRNERTLYKRACSKSQKSIISIYPENTPWPVYDQKVWWGDDWDAKEYAKEYDANRPFFEQWIELRNSVPRISLLNIDGINSDYVNNAGHSKNCYLIFASENNGDCMYDRRIDRCRNVVDCASTFDCENCYELIDCRSCSNVMFSERCQTSIDSLFCFDARDCQNCILSSNIRHAQYMIENVQCTKEEFEQKKKEILGSYDALQEAKKKFEKIRSEALVKYSYQTKCHKAVGDYMHNCHDTWIGFDAESMKNCKYVADVESSIDCYDINNVYAKSELCLDVMGSLQSYNCKFGSYYMFCNDSEYCDSCHNSADCFGCVGLRKSQYCILNKQYTKEEYEQLKEKIISDMKEQGVYGDFLPPNASPFGYNEVLAKEYYPLEQDEALRKGYRWQDVVTGQFGKETIKAEDMPQTIQEVEDTLLQEVLADEVTGQNFRITAGELAFYRQMGIPLPRRSFETRHQDRMNKRNPRKLWKRTTADGKEVLTTYAPDRPEIILSEEEYQQRVG